MTAVIPCLSDTRDHLFLLSFDTLKLELIFLYKCGEARQRESVYVCMRVSRYVVRGKISALLGATIHGVESYFRQYFESDPIHLVPHQLMVLLHIARPSSQMGEGG